MARYPKDNGTIMQTNTQAKDIESPITFPGLGIVRGVHWFRTKTLLSVAVAGPGVAVSGRSQPRPGLIRQPGASVGVLGPTRHNTDNCQARGH